MSVPALRFEDDDGEEFPEWEKRNISEILKIGSGKDYKKLESGDIPVYGTGGYMLSVNDYLYDGESVCIGRKGTIDRPVLLSGKFWTVDTLFYTHSFVSSLPKFIYAVFQNIDWKNYNEASGVPSLSKSTIEKIEVFIPSLPEQTKIANFLTAVDEKITLLTQKADLLSQYKKGLMQQIFSQELRFKDDDGQEFPEWEESELGKVSTITMGQSPDSKSYNDIDEGQPLIQGNADISKRKTNPRIWTSQPTKECKINDIILTVRAPVGAVAKSYHNACIGRGVCAIRNIDKGTTNFIYQLLLWFEPTKWVSLEQGSTFTAVNSNDIKTLTIPVPCLKEQTKIANFLTAIDEKITTNQTQLNAVKQYKQGLLQQMFV